MTGMKVSSAEASVTGQNILFMVGYGMQYKW